MNRIRIKLKAYDYRLLDKSVAEIIKNTRNTGAKIVGPVPLPTERSLYTVLRSPHVNKKAQEQFEMLVHKRLIDIVNPTPQTTSALKKLSLPAGVHVEIKA
jgi:small subunit ribosomal protein S10